MSASEEKTNSAGGAGKVVEFFRQRVLSGELKVGDRLPPERDLCVLLGISRPSLREGMKALSVLGVIDSQQGRGAFVGEANPAILGDVLSFSLAQQPNVIEDVMQVRMAIECHAIRLACGVATEADLAEISRRLEVFVDSLQDPERGGRADHAFHLALVEASDSPSLITVYRTLEPLLVRSHVNRRQLVAADLSVTSSLVQAHKDILVAVMKGDPDEAERCLRGHFAIGARMRRDKFIASVRDIGVPLPTPHDTG